jgi:uncharacterized protein YdeI (YjbR/CyaY-like superfamily)
MSSSRGQKPDMSSEVNIVEAGTADDWRAWLAGNCRSAKEVWLVLRHHDSGTPSLRYHEAVEQALCFGWINGLHRRYGADSSRLRFTPRTARSRWSQLNRQRAAKMIELGLMTEHGQTAIERAKAAGTWQLLPHEPRWAIPDELQAQHDGNDTARTNFESFPPSSKRRILEWIAISKRPDTRQRRIDQTVNLAALNIRANHPRNTRACPTLLRVARLDHLAPSIVSTIVACPFARQRRCHRDRAFGEAVAVTPLFASTRSQGDGAHAAYQPVLPWVRRETKTGPRRRTCDTGNRGQSGERRLLGQARFDARNYAGVREAYEQALRPRTGNVPSGGRRR